MEKQWKARLGGGVLGLLLAVSAVADEGSLGQPLLGAPYPGTRSLRRSNGVGIAIGKQISDKAGAVLVQVEYTGVEGAEESANEMSSDYFNLRGKKVRYFWVTGQVGWQTSGEELGALPTMSINVAPIVVLGADKDSGSEQIDRAFIPITLSYRRDLSVGQKHMFTARAIGYRVGFNTDEARKFSAFVNLALDFIGFNVAVYEGNDGKNYMSGGYHYVGADVQAGLALRAGESVMAQLSLGGRADMSGLIGANMDADVFARFSLGLQGKAFQRYAGLSVYAQAGSHSFYATSSEAEEGSDPVRSETAKYLTIGFAGNF